jgi:hypothetical protein
MNSGIYEPASCGDWKFSTMDRASIAELLLDYIRQIEKFDEMRLAGSQTIRLENGRMGSSPSPNYLILLFCVAL